MTWQYWVLCGGLITGGLGFFFVISRFGAKIVDEQSKYEVANKSNNNDCQELEAMV